MPKNLIALVISAILASFFSATAFAHGVSGGDAAFLERISGASIFPFMYLGAKHMVTGYDHLMFLAGVIFFLYRIKDIGLYVTLFAIGHSTTLMFGVLAGIHANAYIVDAIIGLSVVYKGFENIGGFKRLGIAIDTRLAVLVFGFAHGFGLSTKLQDLALSQDGLVTNMISFNVGVELGQYVALVLMLIAFNIWRTRPSFVKGAFTGNVALMSCGFMLFGYQMAGYYLLS
jgi:hypothetical protein